MEAIFRLAEQISGPVLMATNAQMSMDQIPDECSHYLVQTREELGTIKKILPNGVTLVTGCEMEGQRVEGLSFQIIEELNEIAHSHDVPLIMITDKSKLKQTIPDFVDTVMLLTNLNDLDQPLSTASVPLPENFLKSLPINTRRLVLFDQANTPEKAAAVKEMVKPLQEIFHIVMIGDMTQKGDEVRAAFVRVAGVILAAGKSTRMKRPKQLLEWQGQPFVRVAAAKAFKAGLDPVVVVTGAYREMVVQAVDDLPVKLVHNPLWKAGQSTSVKTGVDSLPEEIGAVIIFLIDQPKIPISFIQTMIDTHARTLAPIIAPLVDYQRNNPVMFDRVTFKDFSGIEGDVGGRQIFSKHQITWVPWVDSSAFIDVDTIEDYKKLNTQ